MFLRRNKKKKTKKKKKKKHFMQNLNMGVNDKARTNLDLHKGSNLGMVVYAIKRPYPKVGVGQI